MNKALAMMLAALAFAAFAVGTNRVTMTRLGSLNPRSGEVVTDVTFEGLADAANVYTKAETEEKIVELAPAPGDYANVSNRAMSAVQTETDPVFDAWKVSPQVDHLDIVGTEFPTGMIPLSGNYSTHSWRWYRDYVAITRNFYQSYQMVSNQTVRVYLPDHAEIHDNDTFLLYSQVPSWAKAASKPTYTADEVGALPARKGNSNIYYVDNDAHFEGGAVFESEYIYFKRGFYFGGAESRMLNEYGVEILGNLIRWPTRAGMFALTNDIPAIPAWAMAETKPTYTAAEVGAYSTDAIDAILQNYLPLDYFQNGRTIPMYWGDGTKLCDFGANWLGILVDTVNEKPDDDDIPPAVSNVVTKAYVENLGITSEETDPTVPQWAKAPTKPSYTASEVGATSPVAVSNIVTTAYVRERLGVYLYVGEDGGIYVHTNEE